MQISLIAAVANDNVIGKDNSLIWHLPADMKFFKETTLGHCVVTGRKNYESIPEKYRPLPNRTNIIVTRQANYVAPGAIVVNTIADAIKEATKKNEEELFIIGGAEIYRQTIDVAHKLYITHIYQNFEGDTFFPTIDTQKWQEVSKEDFFADDKNKYPYSFAEYKRVND